MINGAAYEVILDVPGFPYPKGSIIYYHAQHYSFRLPYVSEKPYDTEGILINAKYFKYLKLASPRKDFTCRFPKNKRGDIV